MSAVIEKVKISNFLSFFGEYEVNLTPFTVIMCNFYEGKDDFFRAFEFVLGANLSDLRVEKPLDLVHKVLKEEFLINRDIHSCVEITLNILQEKKQVKLSRSIKNGINNPRIEHKISDLLTSSPIYEEKLNALGVHINQKNLIYYKSYFNNVIWGSAEDLERTICNCLRESYLFEEWKKANNEVEYLAKLKSHTGVKDYNAMKKSNAVISEYSKKFKAVSSHMETAIEEVLESSTNDTLSTDTSSATASAAEQKVQEEVEMKQPDVLTIESKIRALTENLDNLKLTEAILTSHLHHEEIKLAAKPVNAGLLRARISVIKTEIHEKENQMSEIWEKIQEVKSELENLGQKISFSRISLQELEIRKFLQNRLTQYGRFHDYLRPSRYVQVLKQIIGVDIFYAHLCDTVEDAVALVERLRDLKYEHREVFLPFENYSHKLKDIITASGEKGIQINTLEELLIFICKLKHYEIIDEVPVIVQRDFNFEEALPGDYTIFIQNNLYFGSDGLISVKIEENDFFIESENEIDQNLFHLYKEEETNYRKWGDLLFLKWKTLADMNSLENDVFCLKQKWRKTVQEPRVVRESSPTMEIYEEYSEIFKEYAKDREKYESELQQEEELLLSEKDSSETPNEESVSVIVNELEDVITQRTKIQNELQTLTQELYLLDRTLVCDYRRRRNFFKFQNNLDKSKLFFEKEIKKLKKLMTEDDLEDFLGSQEWRTTFIASLIRDFEEIKMKLKSSTIELQIIATERKKRLYQLFDHCNRYLTSTFRYILDGALPFIKLNFGPGEGKIHVFSCFGEGQINLTDISHFNTFLKFISVFSIFLEIARFDKIPFIVIDDIEEYFPLPNDNLTAILDSSTIYKILPENENPRFHLLMRVGQFLQHYVKKNTPGKIIRNNGSKTDYRNGPTQIICFAKEDFIHTSKHHLWIQNKILPDAHISESCNSYSGIYEINLGSLSN